MHCTNCGTELPEGSAFCTNCGTRVAVEEPQVIPADPVVEPVAESAVQSGPVEQPAPAKNGFDVKTLLQKLPNPKEIDWKHLDWKKLALPVGIAVAAVVVIILVIALISGSGTNCLEGLTNVIDEGNFTVKTSIMGQKIELNVKLDAAKQELTAYGEAGDNEIGIIDGQMIVYNEEFEYGYVTDISDEVEMIFEAYAHFEKGKWEDLIDLLEDMDVEIATTIADVMDMKSFEKAMNSLIKDMGKKRWLSELGDYEVEKEDGVTTYTFEPNMYKLSTTVLEHFEKSFDKRGDYKDAMEYLKDRDTKAELKKADASIELSMEGKYLVELDADLMGNEFKLSFSDIGDTKVDEDRLEELLEELE